MSQHDLAMQDWYDLKDEKAAALDAKNECFTEERREQIKSFLRSDKDWVEVHLKEHLHHSIPEILECFEEIDAQRLYHIIWSGFILAESETIAKTLNEYGKFVYENELPFIGFERLEDV